MNYNRAEMRKKKWEHWKTVAIYLMIYDIIVVNGSYFAGLLLRFDLTYSAIPAEYLNAFFRFAPFYTVFSLIVFWLFNLYNSMWRFASFSELNRILAASGITTVFHVIGITVFVLRMPISYYIFGAVIQFCLVTAIRFAYRYINLERARREKNTNASHNAMIIGAGAAGQVILKELKSSNGAVAKPRCVIDDNPNKWGRRIEGIPIVGGRESILEAAEKYGIDQIMLAMPSASAEKRRDILDICKETGCELKILPGIYQLANGELTLSKMKPVAVEDLLGRETIKVDLDEIMRELEGKTILVTGGGGSIGSELCRQIAGRRPKRLIIFDIYENNAYEIEQELKRKYPQLALTVLIGSVRDSRRMELVFRKYRPDIVYHAAAHKHVPLMETSPAEAIKNNVVGTYVTAYWAMRCEAKRFVLISTDKAVNPTNIMGASKRLCEMVIQCMDAVSKEGRTDLLPRMEIGMMGSGSVGGAGTVSADEEGGLGDGVRSMTLGAMAATDDNFDSKIPAVAAATAGGIRRMIPEASGGTLSSRTSETDDCVKIACVRNKDRKGTQFVAVRFGNVLGSNGSVIPLFKKQIAAGGPVTVTHPDIIRYFMTIPEAVSLVLQAGAYAWGGEVFVLDMGEPVKIDTLARNLIKLSGYKPDVDIKIKYVGLRPGEKLFEEKLMAEEGLKKTDNELIHIGKPIPFDTMDFLKKLERLAYASYEGTGDIVGMVEEMVPTFRPEGREKPEADRTPGQQQRKKQALSI